MNNAEKMSFIEQARSELVQRITQTDKLCDQIKRGYSAYSSFSAQIFRLVVLALVFAVFIWAWINLYLILDIFSSQNYDRDLVLAKLALAGICLFLILHLTRQVIRITKIAGIDDLVSNIRNIKKHLQKNIDNLSGIASEAEKVIFSEGNKNIVPEYNVDADIAKYSNLAKTYSNEDKSWLSITLTIMHWLSGALFVNVFLLISAPYYAQRICQMINSTEYGLATLVYAASFLLLFITTQEWYAKNNVKHLHEKIKKTAGILFIIGICGFIFYTFFLPQRFASFAAPEYDSLKSYVFKAVNVLLPLMIGAAFSSIICFFCKIKNVVINVIFIICLYGTLYFYIINVNKLISVNYQRNFLGTVFALSIPLMEATLFSSIISIISKIKTKIFFLIVIGCGIIYTIISLFTISNIIGFSVFTSLLNFSEGINTVTRILVIIAAVIVALIVLGSGGGIGGIIITAICAAIAYFLVKYIVFLVVGIVLFALIAIIPLLPGLILLFIDSRFSEKSYSRSKGQSYKITIPVFFALSAIGIFIMNNYNEYTAVPPVIVETEDVKTVIVIPDALNLRAEPSGNAEIVKILYKGAVLTVTGENSNGWMPVEHENEKGWVWPEYVK